MAKKKIGAYIDTALADEIDRAARAFDGHKSELIAAALLLFLRASDDERREALKLVLLDRVERFLERERAAAVRTLVLDDAPRAGDAQARRQLSRPSTATPPERSR